MNTANCFILNAFVFAALLCLVEKIECKKESELQVIVEHKPDDCSTYAEDGDEVGVHYTGYLETGAVFDSSIQQNRDPIKFVLGQKRVIRGWEEGIKGMCVGEKRKLVIPPNLGYGKAGNPPVIPPMATLTFETQLMELNKPGFELWEQKLLQTARFLMLPALVIYIVYYLYKKYKEEADNKSKDGETKNKDGRRKKKR